MKLKLPKPTDVDRLLEALALLADELDRRIAFGTGRVTFTGLGNSASITVAYELDQTPTAILCTPGVDAAAGGGNFLNSAPAIQVTQVLAPNAGGTFTTRISTVDAQVPGFGDTIDFYWLAIR